MSEHIIYSLHAILFFKSDCMCPLLYKAGEIFSHTWNSSALRNYTAFKSIYRLCSEGQATRQKIHILIWVLLLLQKLTSNTFPSICFVTLPCTETLLALLSFVFYHLPLLSLTSACLNMTSGILSAPGRIKTNSPSISWCSPNHCSPR